MVKAFGDVARKASVLSLDASQDLHWFNFSLGTPLSLLVRCFFSQARLDLEELFIESLLSPS